MAYRPPHKRTSEDHRSNIFKHVEVTINKSKEPDININESSAFPSLGESTANNTRTVDHKLNYASSLFKPQPKEEPVKKIQDGWVRIQKNKTPKYLYGAKSKNFKDFQKWLSVRERDKMITNLLNILDRHEEYAEIDYFLYGPEHIYSWEVNDYLEDMKREQKKNKGNNSSDESSDSEIDYE